MQPFSIKAAISYGWAQFKANFEFLLVAFAIVMVGPSIITGIAAWLGVNGVAFELVRLAVSVLSIIMSMGLFVALLKLYRNESFGFHDIFENYERFFPFIFSQIISSVLTLIGFILLIVPGIILSIRFFFAPIIIVDSNFGPIEALKESGRLTKGVKMQLFKFFIVLILLNILGFIALVVGLLVTIPITWIAMVYVYHKLRELKSTPVSDTVPAPVSEPVQIA
jgi:uncharacterized membrane protein